MEKHRHVWVAWYVVMFSAVVGWMGFRPHIPPPAVGAYSGGIGPTRVSAGTQSSVADFQLRRMTQHMLMR
jgi:hypothetical protein